MLLYLHHRDSKIFFHPAKFDNFKDEKISDYKTARPNQLHTYEQLFAGQFFTVFVGNYFYFFSKINYDF